MFLQHHRSRICRKRHKSLQSDGQVAWQWAYSAFGDEKPTIAKNRFANTDLTQSFGTTSVPAVTFNLRYPGQYFDQESNLHYNYHRSYSATTGRYTQADPIGLDGVWNRFGYVGQNPLSNIDPTGLDFVVITGGRKEASNPFGHSAFGVTGSGVFSYGNGTSLGGSIVSYITSQSATRNQQITIIPTTAAQDAAALGNLYGQGCKNCIGTIDNCAVRTNSAIEAAGFRTGATAFPGSVARDVTSLPGAQTYTVPQGGPIPPKVIDALRQFSPPNVP
jgi:RHS repeat-associated protein